MSIIKFMIFLTISNSLTLADSAVVFFRVCIYNNHVYRYGCIECNIVTDVSEQN